MAGEPAGETLFQQVVDRAAHIVRHLRQIVRRYHRRRRAPPAVQSGRSLLDLVGDLHFDYLVHRRQQHLQDHFQRDVLAERVVVMNRRRRGRSRLGRARARALKLSTFSIIRSMSLISSSKSLDTDLFPSLCAKTERPSSRLRLTSDGQNELARPSDAEWPGRGILTLRRVGNKMGPCECATL